MSPSLSEELCPHCLFGLALSSPEEEAAAIDAAAPTMDLPAGVLASGAVLGERYRIRKLLGRGGMGEVWRAYDLKLRVDVALKSLHTEWLANERMLETLRQEVRLARQVVSPNVCRVFDLVELDGSELVTMEYVDGTTLLKVLAERAPLDLEEARGIAAQLLAGLEAIHDAGLVHRDLKPENLMLTRAGRVVIMDFGIAKGLAEGQTGTVAGTPGYMAPEQLQGGGGDARADLYSVGVVLAEMVAPGGLPTKEAREAIWQGVHHDPPQVAETPWAAVIRKAVARRPEDRWPSASALARALEEVTLRVAGAETLQPYPGLSSFTAQDAEYFFGREYEIEAVWKKLRHAHLLALIGPSGAGKSSFLRAGLLPAMPAGWTAIVATPGNRPLASLAQALARELAGDPQAIEQLLNFDQPDVAVSLVARWRRRHEQALVVVDQFEELFTLNPPEVQQRFAGLLARLALEADARVVVSMRDDFLFRCHDHEALAPLFSELTPLGAPTGAALRRAVVQPALKCGYRFEDDVLVDDMLREVEGERGALPMLAFAASQLWARRDREQGVLTREAYQQIGGVAGALAQHADATLERIGQERAAIVRELFRNLVTAQGTRAVRDREELLSVFSDGNERDAASAVLDALIDARLLTSYDVPAEDEQRRERHRIEIVHESLLSNWPRLVRWQTQDADGAQLRDQVRQAAQMWEQHSRSEDLLWTGTAFQEFQLWKERYPGNLSEQEEAFASAMQTKATKRRRQRRLAIAALFALLVGVALTLSAFWRRSESARELAEDAARRSEASNLFGLAKLQPEDEPSAFLAYAIASLERVDLPEVRYEIVRSLWRGLADVRLPAASPLSVDFSPDGRWLATASEQDGVRLWPSDGGPPTELVDSAPALIVRFSPTGNAVAAFRPKDPPSPPVHELAVWSVADGRRLRTVADDSLIWAFGFAPAGDRLLALTETRREDRLAVEVLSWPVAGGDPARLDAFDYSVQSFAPSIDATGSRLAWADGDRAFVAPLDQEGPSVASAIQVEHQVPVLLAHVDAAGRRLATIDSGLTGRLWSLQPGPPRLLRTLPGKGDFLWLRFGLSERWLGASGGFLWDLGAPPDAEFRPLSSKQRILNKAAGSAIAFDPRGRWFATGNREFVSLWPLSRPTARILRGHEGAVGDLVFTPDGRWLISAGRDDGSVRLWPLDGAAGPGSRVLYRTPVTRVGLMGEGVAEVSGSIETDAEWPRSLAMAPDGSFVAAATNKGRLVLLSLDTLSTRVFESGATQLYSVAVGPRSRFVAAGGTVDFAQIWDMSTGAVHRLGPDCITAEEPCDQIGVDRVEFTATGELLVSSDQHGRQVRRWSLDGDRPRLVETHRAADESTAEVFAVRAFSDDGGHALRVAPNNTLWLDDLRSGTSRRLETHGRVFDSAFDPSGRIVVSGDSTRRGEVRVGSVDGGETHLLLGHEHIVLAVAVSPDGRWVASGSIDGTIRLWPMPDLSRPPLHTLPHDELVARLRKLTNLRAVEDPDSATSWKLEIGSFPGWEEEPSW